MLTSGGTGTVRLLIVLPPKPLVIAAAVPLTVALPTTKGTEVLPPWVISIDPPPILPAVLMLVARNKLGVTIFTEPPLPPE